MSSDTKLLASDRVLGYATRMRSTGSFALLAVTTGLSVAVGGGTASAASAWFLQGDAYVTNPVAGDKFGVVAISGDTLVVGVPNAGVVYVYTKPASGWTGPIYTPEILTATDAGSSERFGGSVAIDGDTIVVGAPREDTEGTDAGAAYVYVKPPGGWEDATQTAKLTSTGSSATHRFGDSVAVAGDTVAIGSPGGISVYVYEKPLAGWADATVQTARLGTSDVIPGNLLGSAVAMRGSTIVAGAGAKDSGTGAIYVFERAGASWTNASVHTAKLLASDRAEGDQLGFTDVAFDSDTIVAGVPTRTVSGHGFAGAAYVWNKPGGGWSGTVNEDAKLTAFDAGGNDNFGSDVEMLADKILIGAAGADIVGAAYVFEKPVGGWTGEIQGGVRLDPPAPAALVSAFGASVALADGTAFVASPQTDALVTDQGIVMIYGQSRCPSAPIDDCRVGATGSGKLQLSEKGDLATQKILWKWVRGEAFTPAELGDPTADTNYAVCLFDGAGTLWKAAELPAGADCSGKPCWKAAGSGYKFKDKTGSRGGITGLLVSAGADGKTKALVKGKGVNLSLPTLPLLQSPDPVVAQIVNDAGTACWSASFGSPALSSGGTTVWSDSND